MFIRYNSLSVLCILFTLFATSGCSTGPSATPQAQQSTSIQQTWTIRYQRSGGIMGLAQSAEFTSAGARSLSNFDKPAQTLEALNPSALAHLSNLVNLASNEAPPKETNKTHKCADCINESVQLRINGSVVYYANNAPLPEAQEELLRFLAEHTPMR